MLPANAKAILESLADGIDPDTGEALPEQDIFNRPLVIRALYAAIRALDGAGPEPAPGPADGKTASSQARPTNAGKPWAAIDDEELLAAFDAGAAIKEIADQFSRSRGAITSRLVRLGRIRESEEASR